jgi:hypothetical protein
VPAGGRSRVCSAASIALDADAEDAVVGYATLEATALAHEESDDEMPFTLTCDIENIRGRRCRSRLAGKLPGREPLDACPANELPAIADKRRMEGQRGTPRRRERVVFETDDHVVIGDVTLPPEGYQSRFSDAVNREGVAFIPLVDVQISPHGGGDVVSHAFIVLSKAHVRFAYPFDEQ